MTPLILGFLDLFTSYVTRHGTVNPVHEDTECKRAHAAAGIFSGIDDCTTQLLESRGARIGTEP